MAEPFKAAPEIYGMMQNLIANHQALSGLALIDDEILIIMKDKATETGGVVIAGKTSKANNLLGLVGEKPYKFVITLAADVWTSLSDHDREAMLFHYLMACGIEENPDSGVMKTFLRPTQFNFYREEVEAFGFWHTSGTTPDAALIEELFGEKPDPAAPKAKKTRGPKGPPKP